MKPDIRIVDDLIKTVTHIFQTIGIDGDIKVRDTYVDNDDENMIADILAVMFYTENGIKKKINLTILEEEDEGHFINITLTKPQEDIHELIQEDNRAILKDDLFNDASSDWNQFKDWIKESVIKYSI